MEDKWPSVLFTKEFQDKAKLSPVLVVGAGGIGSEVLKTLVVTGFRNISVVDSGTVGTSNLNRQFLFRSVDVGSSKAYAAAEAVKKFLPAITEDASMPARKMRKDDSSSGGSSRPAPEKSERVERDNSLEIRPHQADIKDRQFGVDFFRSFDVVLTCLDNLNARRHVNHLCRVGTVPLIESGTSGYEGSVTVHLEGNYHLCGQKPTPSVFSICTIRNTPNKLIHCVTWAKELLFPRLFGDPNISTDLDEMRETDNSDTDGFVGSFFLKRDGEPCLDYAMRLFGRLFSQDIDAVLQMKDLWKTRTPPVPLQWEFGDGEDVLLDLDNIDMHKVLMLSENARLFVSSVCAMHNSRSQEIGRLTFDKDDDLAVQLVTAAANLRAVCYGIPPSSIFEIKGMAGNIVQAIAPTNATIAGLVVIEACKVLCDCKRHTKESFVGKHCLLDSTKRRRDTLIKSVKPPWYDDDCVIREKSTVYIALDTVSMTLGQFLEKVVRGRLGVIDPNLLSDDFMYEEGEGLDEDEKEEYEAMLPMPLAALPGGGLADGSMVAVQSQVQQFSCKVILTHNGDIDEDMYPERFILDELVRSGGRSGDVNRTQQMKRKIPSSPVGPGKKPRKCKQQPKRKLPSSSIGPGKSVEKDERDVFDLCDSSSDEDEAVFRPKRKKKRANKPRKHSHAD